MLPLHQPIMGSDIHFQRSHLLGSTQNMEFGTAEGNRTLLNLARQASALPERNDGIE